MRLLIQCNYDPENRGGIEAVTRQLIEILKTFENVKVEVISGHEADTVQERDGYTYHGSRIVKKIGGAVFLKFGNWRFIRASKNADAILFQEPFPTLLPAIIVIRFILRKKVVALVHAKPHMPAPLKKIYHIFRRELLSRLTVVATSPILLEQLELRSGSRAQVIPLSLNDETRLEPPALNSKGRALMGALPSKYLLYFGRLAGYKGLEFLMPAIEGASRVQVVIAGTGQGAAFVEEYIAGRNLRNVTFLNRYLTEPEKLHLIQNCFGLILPSTSSSEAFAIVQLEAMFFSRPIINTRLNNGVNYVAPDGIAALTATPKNSGELSALMLKLWDDIELAHRLGLNGKKRLNELFSYSQFEQSWGRLLKSLLSGPANNEQPYIKT